VVLFLVDGVTTDAVLTAAANGATNLAFVLANGVRVETAHSTSPAAVIQLPVGSPGGTQPWARATSGNVAVHTGCHLFESNQMDDIFLAARAAGIKSVFSGGDDNYAVFTTADFHTGTTMDDDVTLGFAIDHLRNDHARLLRIHLQRVRDFWTGPADKTNPNSTYIRHLVQVDGLLGTLISALKDEGVWDSTYLVVAADHGMGQDTASTHVASTVSSWDPFMAFYGPDLKKGTTIPYAELPDVAVTTMRFFGLPPLKGHLDRLVTIPVKGATGTVLTNLFLGQPDVIPHPRYIQACLNRGTACTSTGDDFASYRQTMLNLIQ
jgi:Sulfatase